MNPSPLEPYLEGSEAAFIPFGDNVRIVGELEGMELEYAAVRKAAAMLDCPHRGLLRVTGGDRLDFLHRMLTNDCNSLKPGSVQRNFLLNTKGRIIADLLLIARDDETLIDLGAHQASAVAEELDRMLFGEDVQIADLTDSHHRVSIHGPKAERVLTWWHETTADKPGEHWSYRYDETGEAGYHLWASPGLIEMFATKQTDLAETFDLRPIGWLAFNIARIEAGRPAFNIDFGSDSLPHETGVLNEAVSFTKGCYRGQEVVARMQSLGHPAKLLMGFRCQDSTAIPVAGVPIYDGESAESNVVGAVTSSTFSPLLSNAPIGFGMVKWAHRAVGTQLYAPAEGRNVPIVIHELQFVPSHA